MTLTEFIARAILVPFVNKGRDWHGWDCWGMLRLFHDRVLRIDLPDYSESYTDAGHSAESRERLATLFQTGLTSWRAVSEPEPGDGVLLNIGGRPIHVGLAIGEGRMLHTSRRINTVIERLDAPMWARRIEGFYRHAG